MKTDVLNYREEEQVMRLFQARAREPCQTEVKALNECSRHRTITSLWACGHLKRLRDDCIKLNSTKELYDECRTDFIRFRDETKAAREEKKRNETRRLR